MRSAWMLVVLAWLVAGCGSGGGKGGGGNGNPTPTNQVTARCQDGAVSTDTECASACSANGGVAEWYRSGCGPANPRGIAPITARAFAVSAIPQSNDPGAARVDLLWTPPPSIPAANLIEYHVFRDGQIVAVVPPNQTRYVDMPIVTSPEFTYRTPGVPGTSTGTGQSVTLTTITASLTPMEVGISHRYRITMVHQISAGGTVVYRESQVGTESGLVTPLPRPGAIGPTVAQNLAEVSVTYQEVIGADEYIFEFSTTPDFRNKVTRGPYAGTNSSGVMQSSERFNLVSSFPGVLPGGRIYFRVGARYSRDTQPPIPLETPNGGQFIYSTSGPSFTRLGISPTPP